MANTGVLPFVRGVDFTKNNFEVRLESKVAPINGYLLSF